MTNEQLILDGTINEHDELVRRYNEHEIDWYIHVVVPNTDDESIQLINAHTHGLQERFNHLDFQLVLGVNEEWILGVLNFLGNMVKEGKFFTEGEYVSGIFENHDAYLKLFKEMDRAVLRVIVPTKDGLFPENPECPPILKHQLDKIDF